MMARGLSPHVELLRVSAPPAPPPTPPPPEEEEEEGGMDSDEESLAAARVPKAELLLRLFTTGRGFRRLLYSSFLQNALGQQPELRALHHVTEGPYVHACLSRWFQQTTGGGSACAAIRCLRAIALLFFRNLGE